MEENRTRRRAILSGLAVGGLGLGAYLLGSGSIGDGGGDGSGGGGGDDGSSGGAGSGDTGSGSAAGYLQYQYDAANTGRTDDAGPSGSVSTAWEVPTDAPTDQPRVLTPAVADGTVYVPVGAWNDQATLHAVDAATGERQWMTPPVTLDNIGTPAIADGTLYGAVGRDLKAIDAASGEEQWAVRINPNGADPVLTDDSVVIQARETLYAYDREGTERWTYAPSTGERLQTPAAADGTVYLAAENLTALSADGGAEQWTAETDSPVTTAPTVGSEAVYVGTDDGILAAFDRADGTERWSVDTDSFFGLKYSFALGDHVVYATARESVTAYSTADGSEQWSVEVRTGGAPVLAGDALFVRDVRHVTALAATDGTERWHHEIDANAGFGGPPVVYDGGVYAAIGMNTLIALEEA